MLDSIKVKLEEDRAMYDDGTMMSLMESMEGKWLCDKALEQLNIIQEMDISEEDKVTILKEYIRSLDDYSIRYKYLISNIIEDIDKSISHTIR